METSGIKSETASNTPRPKRLWLVDIENLCGWRRGQHLDTWELQLTVRQFRHLTWPAANDYVVVACDQSIAKTVKLLFPSNQILTARGKDGADKALIRFVFDLNVVRTLFSEVVLVGGDGIYASLVNQLRESGVDVGVISRRSSLSNRLSTSANWIKCLGGRTGGTTSPAKQALRSKQTKPKPKKLSADHLSAQPAAFAVVQPSI